MNTTLTMDLSTDLQQEKPGAYLASLRQQRGLTTDYVAGKLHLRVNIIELLELDDYVQMPEPVFIKGYLRAYAKLLSLNPEPLIKSFDQLYGIEQKPDRTLWQSRRETNKAERTIRWVTAVFALGVIVAVMVFWNSNKDNEHLAPKNVSSLQSASTKSESDIRLTDLSKMRSLLSSVNSPSNSNTSEKSGA